MAGDSSVVGLAKVDPSKIGSLLGNLDMTGSVTLTTNFSEVISGLNDIKSQLNELKNPVEINLQLNPAIKSDLANITNQLNNINNLTGKGGKGSNQRANQTGKGSTRAIPLSKLPNRVGLKKYKDAMQQEVDTFARSIGDKGGKLLRTRVAFDPKSKEYRGIVEYQNELGKTTKAVLALNKADGVYRVASEEVTTNYQAQANALQASNKQLEQQKKLYEDMRSKVEGKGGLTGNYATLANDRLTKFKEALDATKITQDDVNSGKAQQHIQSLEEMGKATQDYITQQFKERDDANKEYLKTVKENSKQLEYDQKQEAKTKADENAAYLNQLKANSKQLEYDQKTQWNAQNLISGAVGEIDKIEKDAFSGTEALTGDYAKKAKEKIQEVRDEFDKLQKSAEGSVVEASKVNKTDLSNMVKNLDSELGRLHDLEYPSSKLAAKNVDALKADYGNKIAEFRDQLKDAGLESSNFTTQLDGLEKSLASVGKIDGTGTPWAEWKNQFDQLQGSFKNFGSTIEGQSLALAKSIDTKQLQEVAQLTDKMTNLPKGMEGTAADSLREKLKGIGDGYREITDQLKAGNLDQGQFDNIKQKVSDLDTQLKEASSSAKIFEEGFKFDKYQLDVEQLGQKFDRLKQKYQDFVNANPDKANGDIEQKLETLGQHVQSLDGNFDPEKLKLYNAELRNTATAVNNVVNPTQSLSQMLSQNFGAVGQYLSRFTSGMFLITKGVQTVKSMVNEVKSLDTSMMELQKVTNLSGSSMDNFADQAYSVGAELGRTGKDVMDAVTTFSRAGYNLDESTELAKSALVMSNVGVDIPNMESAASDMISIMKAFDIEAQDSMSVIDKLYNVANKEPLDFGNITSMLVTVGGTLAQSNTSLEQTMGLLTGGFATLRDNSVANG